MENTEYPDALRRWPARIDLGVQFVGAAVASLAAAAQLAGLVLGLSDGDPITGDRLFAAGFWVAGVGGAGVAYGLQVRAGGSVPHPGGPLTYMPPARRWPATLWAACGIPLWAVLSLPLAALLYGGLIVGIPIVGCVKLVGLVKARRTRRCT
jgi:hypothetical protein